MLRYEIVIVYHSLDLLVGAKNLTVWTSCLESQNRESLESDRATSLAYQPDFDMMVP